MELVEGETSQARIQPGAIPVDEALAIAKQIADALEMAHERGVVHRDLKPGNVMVTPGGTVKVLDFGLAKAYEASPSNPSISNSPTMMSMAATNAGVTLGTAAYMRPEQARGKIVDKRADIWAFGVVLYEMVTGRQLFQGENQTVTLASVVMNEHVFQGGSGIFTAGFRTVSRKRSEEADAGHQQRGVAAQRTFGACCPKHHGKSCPVTLGCNTFQRVCWR